MNRDNDMGRNAEHYADPTPRRSYEEHPQG